MLPSEHQFEVQIYYEDTDFSGFVYHANYLRFFERAREHALGAGELVRLWHEEKKGFVVYKVALSFKQGAVFGDLLIIQTAVRLESEYRLIFEQKAYRKTDSKLLVDSTIELVCVDGHHRPVRIPASARPALKP